LLVWPLSDFPHQQVQTEKEVFFFQEPGPNKGRASLFFDGDSRLQNEKYLLNSGHLLTTEHAMRKLIAAGIGLVILGASIGLADGPAEVKDRKGFIPYRNHQVLKGTAIGILLTDGQPVLGNEGRSGPSDQLVFATGGGSYRWVYVPTGNGTIRN